MFQTKVVEKIKTHILCSVTPPPSPPENRVICEKMRGKILWGGPQITILRMRVACWIPKAINTHPEDVILIAFPLRQWLHERDST